MKTLISRQNITLALGAVALTGLMLSAAPVRAQDAGTADNGKPVSLNLINVPITTALRTLFNSAGVRNFSIDPGVQGNANVTVSDVSFSVALRALLNSGNPPLTFSVDNGVYTIKVQQAAPTPTATVASPAGTDPNGSGTSTADQPKRFYTIPIDSYDAYYIATLVGQTGIVEVLPNYPSGTTSPTGQGGQGGQGFGAQGGRGGFGGGLSAPVTSIGGGGFGGFYIGLRHYNTPITKQ